MHKFKTTDFIISCCLFLVIVFALPCSAANQTIKHQDIQKLVSSYQDQNIGSFEGFLGDVAKNTDNSSLRSSVDMYLGSEIRDNSDWINIYRLLGIYTRIKHKDELLEFLGRLVAIPTAKQEGMEQFENPGIIRFGEEIGKISSEFGLEFRNVDNRIFEVILQGDTDESFGVYTHGDVVPADSNRWVLEDGTKLEPYKITIIGDKIYGRGTEDDKCSIVVTLAAMNIIKNLGLKIKRSIRLIIETTEETGGEGIEYYKTKYG